MTDRPADDDLPDDLDLDLGEDVDEFADEAQAAAATPAEPPPETAAVDSAGPTFFDAGLDLHQLDDVQLAGRPSVLERLGPAHFRSKGFSFMGFLQTVYDHVAEQTRLVPSPGTPGEG